MIPTIAEFRQRVWAEGAAHARDELPWRHTRDPYAIWLSEVMLQQTQVTRVLRYWQRFLDEFPTLVALAQAETAQVLSMWQGLGYNRRGLALFRCAQECAKRFDGQLPRDPDQLRSLPGIGPTTAAGIMAFAYNEPAIYIETNVRAVFISQFFPEAENSLPAAPAPQPLAAPSFQRSGDIPIAAGTAMRSKVTDRQLEPLLREAMQDQDPRTWYYALLDWGAHMKSTGANATRRSAHYQRQGAFEGSHRQKRSFILREVLATPGIPAESVHTMLNAHELAAGRSPLSEGDFTALVAELQAEGFLRGDSGRLLP